MENNIMNGLKKYAVAVMLCVLILSGCSTPSGNTTENTLGEIHVISRENGSGTKAQFEESIGLLGVKSDSVAESTEDIIKAVEEDTNAIGYAAGAAAQDSNVKAVTVNGIEANTKNIKKGKYPLSRDYSLVYNGEMSDVQEDFLRYIDTAGQKTVADYCIPASKEQTFLSNKASGNISITGSSSMEGVMKELVKEYRELNPNADIGLTITDSEDGIQKAMRGTCDFGMSSRNLKPYEDELLECFVLGRDAIDVIVNTENVIENITTKQLRDVYSGEVFDWGEIK